MCLAVYLGKYLRLCLIVDMGVCEDICNMTHPRFESDEFEKHFHSEDSGEDHIKNVHYIVKECRLAIVLQKRHKEGWLKKTEEKGAVILFYALN